MDELLCLLYYNGHKIQEFAGFNCTWSRENITIWWGDVCNSAELHNKMGQGGGAGIKLIQINHSLPRGTR